MNEGPSDSEPPPGGIGSPRPQAAAVEVTDPDLLLSPREREQLRELAAAAIQQLEVTGEVRVRVVDDAAMAQAHARYSGVPGTTDVLTFDLSSDPGAGLLDADLLVCADEARRQCAARGHPVEHELLLYIVHGVLHCLGFDDHDDTGYAAMHAREDQVLAAIGVGPVFHTARPSGGAA